MLLTANTSFTMHNMAVLCLTDDGVICYGVVKPIQEIEKLNLVNNIFHYTRNTLLIASLIAHT